jgi:hypothetical protein
MQWLLFVTCLFAPTVAGGQTMPPIAAVVETTLTSAPGQIRQFAFDGNPDTYFASATNAGKSDHFTLVFDVPVALKSVSVTTGKPKGGDTLESGILEVSTDGQTFAEVAKFTNGVARAKPGEQKVKAIRVKPTSDLAHPLVIREFAVDSEPRVAVFKYPVEFIVDVSDAPEMKEWADKVARICERNYRMINDELPSEAFKPRTVVNMALKSSYKGVAEAGGGRITGSVKFFKAHPEDIGAMIHETVHIVQSYRTRNAPSWLVEGIADYVRFFKYEPGKIGKINADPHYNNSYRTSAAFLNFVSIQYNKELVRKLNKALREGEYRETIWTTLTKKTLKELDEEWRMSMKKEAPKQGAVSLLDANGPPTFRYHNVPDGTADLLAKIIPQTALNPSIRCAPSGSKKLFMYADPTTHSIVQAVIGTMYFVQIVADECRPIMPRVR